MTAETRQASELAAAVAEQAHGGVQHGDNDPALTDQYKARVAAVDVLVPRLSSPASGRPMSWAWADHLGDYPWSIRDAQDTEVGMVWVPPGHEVVVDDPEKTVRRMTGGAAAEARRLRDRQLWNEPIVAEVDTHREGEQ